MSADATDAAISCEHVERMLRVDALPGARAFCPACKCFGMLQPDGGVTISREAPKAPAFDAEADDHNRRRDCRLKEKPPRVRRDVFAELRSRHYG